METGGLVVTGDEEQVADDLLAALSDLAYSTPSVGKETKHKRHKSRFFFTITSNLSDTVRSSAPKFLPKQMEHIDSAVVKRLKRYKQEVPPQLNVNIDAVREFFLTEIGPRSLAGGAGAGQAKEIVQRLLGTEIDASQFEKFERMSHSAVNLVMAQFVARYYGLPKSSAAQILASLTPRSPSTVPIPPYEARHAKARREIQSTEKGKEADPT